MDLRISDTKYVCVDYPGIVQNHDAMLHTLGGASKVTKVTLQSVEQYSNLSIIGHHRDNDNGYQSTRHTVIS